MTLIFLAFSAELFAQKPVITGQVTELETGEPIIGATVVEIDLNERVIKGTITDYNGNYAIQLSNGGNQLRYSFVGYENITEETSNRTIINIKLSSSTIALEDVVVVAQVTDAMTGINERDRASSAVKVDMSEINKISVTSAADALQGQVTGLDIVSSGAPGSGSQIVIRGLGSLGDSRPLIVVDGIAQDISGSSDFDFGSADVEDLGALVSIAPQDIKSIEVLKDAASTAVWGSQGADGVLMITTNRGSKGKTKFDYNYKVTINQSPPSIPMLDGNEYTMLMLEELHNSYGVFDLPPEIAFDPYFSDYYNYSANTDWISLITQIGITNDHFFKLSGGGEKTQYYASVNSSNEIGTTLNEGYKRLTSRINLDYTLSRKLRFAVNFDYTNSYQDGNWYINEDVTGDGNREQLTVRRMAYVKAPNMSAYEYNNAGELTGEYFTPLESFQGNGEIFFNPLAVANLSERDTKINKFQNSFVLRYRLSKKIRFEETVSFQYQGKKLSIFLPYPAIGTDWLDDKVNNAREQNSHNQKISSRSLFIFVPVSNEVHELSGRLMFQLDQYNSDYTQITTRNGPSISISDPSARALVNNIRAGISETRSLGTLLSMNYKFKDRYITSLILRADANSKFGANNRWGFFPSISLAWRFSKEPFLNSLSWLDDSKLRFSYGQSGKQPGQAYARHGIYDTPENGTYFGGNVVIPIQVQLANLKWQTIESYNLGIDISLFKNRIYFTAEVYNKLTHDLLWRNYDIPSSSGFDNIGWFNGGKVRNRGWESYLRYNPVRRKNFSMSVNFNISKNSNTFLEFPDNFNNIRGEVVANGVFPRQANIGQPIGSFYGFVYQGVYPTDEDAFAKDESEHFLLDANGNKIPMTFVDGTYFQGGDAKYADINYDGVIDINDVQYLGDSNPEFIGGLGSNISYKKLRASFQFMFRTGFEIVNEIAMDTEGMLNKNNQSKAVLHRWRRSGQGVDDNYILPRAFYLHPANNLGSDRYVEPGDFLRLNNLSIGYSFRDNSFIRSINISELEISLNMRKIITFTNYTGQDPEISQRMEDPFWFGTDNGLTPAPRIYSLIFNLRF
jgi:TonB-linked SusC/RagA family outer membrane protein